MTREQVLQFARELVSEPNPHGAHLSTVTGAVLNHLSKAVLELSAENERLREANEAFVGANYGVNHESFEAVCDERDALRAEIENAPVVWGWTDEHFVIDVWTQSPSDEGERPSRRARLVRIEAIPKGEG